MKATTIIQLLIISILSAVITACSSDDDSYNIHEPELVNVTLRLSIDNGITRAWQDGNAETDKSEMMKSWTVVVVDNSGNVEQIVSQTPAEGKEEIDDTYTITLATGTKTFYSFANIDISGWGIAEGSPMPEGFDNKEYQVGETEGGIPMSNKQTITISASTTAVYLIVVRMLAKMKLQFANATSSDLKINSITISEITTGSVYLLPKYDAGGGGADGMEAGNLLPNIPVGSAKSDYTYNIDGGLTVGAGNDTPVEASFYINESEAMAEYPKYFVLTLNIDKGESTDEQRFALLSWDKIARNDYRIIPITLDDYLLDIEPIDFPPIGVLPASVKEEDGKFTVTFHAGGHFHIVPKVKKMSTGEWLSCGDGVGQWTFSSWSSENSDSSAPSIYETEDPASTTDGSDNGGIPVWDATNHYIFGKLKQNETGSAYHELKINVKKSADVSRTLTYKLYIIKE